MGDMVYLTRDIPAFVKYCVNGASRSSLLIESTDSMIYIIILVGCKHRASEVLLYIGGRGLVSQIIEPVTFARCAFIIALRNIALDGYLDTRT